MRFHSGFCIYHDSLEKNALFLKPEFKLDKLLKYSHETAYKSFEEGTNTAKMLELEWLLRITGTKQISQALELAKPNEGSSCLYLSFKGLKNLEKAEIHDLWSLQKKFFGWNGNQEDLELDLIEQRALTFA